jgi:hypothetical protein
MAEQAERVCAVCRKPLDVPRQNATIDDQMCSSCLRLRQSARSYDLQSDVEFAKQEMPRPDYDLHPPGQ